MEFWRHLRPEFKRFCNIIIDKSEMLVLPKTPDLHTQTRTHLVEWPFIMCYYTQKYYLSDGFDMESSSVVNCVTLCDVQTSKMETKMWAIRLDELFLTCDKRVLRAVSDIDDTLLSHFFFNIDIVSCVSRHAIVKTAWSRFFEIEEALVILSFDKAIELWLQFW